MRYYFDIRENNTVAVDEEGLELPDLKAAEIEAARSLADMTKSLPGGAEHHHLAIEVRTEKGRAFDATFIFQITRH
jgi:hypothetical protein